jgi:hypothetical protein
MRGGMAGEQWGVRREDEDRYERRYAEGPVISKVEVNKTNQRKKYFRDSV